MTLVEGKSKNLAVPLEENLVKYLYIQKLMKRTAVQGRYIRRHIKLTPTCCYGDELALLFSYDDLCLHLLAGLHGCHGMLHSVVL